LSPASVVVSVAIVRDGRLLLVQEGKEWCRGQWGLPGGRVEDGEPLIGAAVREVREETGLCIVPEGMTRIVRYISASGFHCVRFNFVAAAPEGEPLVDGTEILAARWFGFEEIDALDEAMLRSPAIARSVIADVRSGAVLPLDIMLDALVSVC
jgi:ADP-ribose pyrophosphatase YjhB (NUDIX family)